MTSPTDDPLVSTDWLAAHLDDPKVRIIDASFKLPGVLPLPVDDYLTGHIPGAVFFDVDAISDHDDPRPHMYPTAAQFARDVAALGISNGDTVVAYDSGGWVAAPRAWWMFLSFGHPNVKVLDGGLKKWLREGRPTHAGRVTAKPGKFLAKFDSSYLRSQQQLVGNLTTHAEQLVDARPRPRFEGTVAEPRPGLRGGHIPGSRNVPYAELFDACDRRDEAARGVAQGLHRRRRRYDKADRDDLRLRRFGAGADACAVSARRARQRALRRIVVRMGPARRTAGRDRSGLIGTYCAKAGTGFGIGAGHGLQCSAATYGRRRRLRESQTKRVGCLLLLQLRRQPRQPRGACRHPAAVGRPPCPQLLLDLAWVRLGAGHRRLRLDGDGWAVQRCDFCRYGVGLGQSGRARGQERRRVGVGRSRLSLNCRRRDRLRCGLAHRWDLL